MDHLNSLKVGNHAKWQIHVIPSIPVGHPMVCGHTDPLSQSTCNYSSRVYVEYLWVTQWSVHTQAHSHEVTIVAEYVWNTCGSPNGLCTYRHALPK